MANVTDPLAAGVHGTDPQNILEYIVRQKIYDSRFWKEECFGLTAADVLEKAATVLKCVGGSFGGNAQPTKFLSLALKLLQIQPSTDIIRDTFLETEDFKYVRALGAFYLRLTARPADIYELLEPLYRDYRILRYREVTEWKLLTIDQFVHSLLTERIVCGIAVPHLADRSTLVEEGYLDEDYASPIWEVVTKNEDSNKSTLESYLYQKVRDGSAAAKVLWDRRQEVKKKKIEEQERQHRILEKLKQEEESSDKPTKYNDNNNNNQIIPHNEEQHIIRSEKKKEDVSGYNSNDEAKKKKKKKRSERSYGSLFKDSTSTTKKKSKKLDDNDNAKKSDNIKVDENSTEYWNIERSKLGLKPLKE